jgi:hypothetical protein
VKKRVVVAYEGRETKEAMPRLLLSGTCTADAEVPVVIAGAENELGRRIGVARDMQRSEHGSISFEIELDDFSVVDELHPAIYLANPFNSIENGVHIFDAGEIKEICFFQKLNAWGE